jgi:lipoyl(octanoyl) transferase
VTPLRWCWLGRRAHREVWQLQEALRDAVLSGDEGAERLLLLEHDPVVTLGRHADRAHVLAPGVDVVQTNRGGDVTVHGPGQLVVYPVVRLTRGIRAHVEAVGGAIVGEAAAHGVAAELRRDPVGVWVGAAKLAACGLHVKRRVAIHGFALNVTDEVLPLFAGIVPCGLHGAKVTSLAREGAEVASPHALAASLAVRIATSLGRTAIEENVADVSITTCSSSPSR